MPGGDGTGPLGGGPMTGRGLGLCAGYEAPAYGWRGRCGSARGYGRRAGGYGFTGRGFGRGQGRGAGLGRWNSVRSSAWAPAPDLSTDLIKEEIALLQDRIEMLSRRLGEVSGKNEAVD